MNKAAPTSALTELTVQLKATDTETVRHNSVTRAMLGKVHILPRGGEENIKEAFLETKN